MTVFAQNVGDAFYIYRNDGQFNAFFRDEVERMEYSYEDADGNTHDKIVTQLVYTADSVYAIPLAAIDSVSFVQPETQYNSQVVHMEPLLPYIVSVDGLTVMLSPNTPSSLMPKVGDILLQDNYESEKLPDGFAGRVLDISGQIVTCESVSFEEVYERIVSYGSYTAVDDEANHRVRLVPRKVSGGISSAVSIGGTLGSEDSPLFLALEGKLALNLRSTLNFTIGKPVYFDLFFEPEIGMSLTAGLKVSSSNNLLEKKVSLLALPIPDTPFYLKIKGGPVLKPSVSASATVSTEAKLGYQIGVKYENGSFKGYCQDTLKRFSTPQLTGSISGSVFAGVGIEFGVYSYGDLLSLVVEKEAGAEFVANLTEDLMNLGSYEEVRKAKFELNLKGSVGVKAEAKFFKWFRATAEWELLSGRRNINSWKLVPAFQQPVVAVGNSLDATVTVKPSEKLLMPVSIGIGLWDNDGNLVDKKYCADSYRVPEEWPYTQYAALFTGLTPSHYYTASPMVRLFGRELKALPVESFLAKGELGELTCPDNNHPHMIDLGLPSGTKWACCNVGASAPEQYGGYYAWGETSEKSVYDLDTYQYYSNGNWVNIGSNISGTPYDVAYVRWGAPWCMPSKAQCDELRANTTSVWTTMNGVYGRKFIGSNGGTIFLPAAGHRWDSDFVDVGGNGHYWSSSLYESTPSLAWYLYFYSGGVNVGNGFFRFYGFSVRPVRKN